MKLLEVNDLTIRYGGITAVSKLSFSVEEGQTVVLTGQNGSGKSSVLLAIMGLVKPFSGCIRFMGEDLANLKPWDRVARGICILPENRRLFEDLTVEENLEIICFRDFSRHKLPRSDTYDRFPALYERRHLPVRLLSGGERQSLAALRMIRQAPILALMDDPCSGLDDSVKIDIMSILIGVGNGRIFGLPSCTSVFDSVLKNANIVRIDEIRRVK